MIINKNIFPGEGFADPHAIVENGRVYIFSGRDSDAKNGDYCRMPKWTIVSSDDLINWRKESDILPTDTYIGDQMNCWAGHIKKKDDTFYWYFSNRNINIGVMTSKNVTGPFVDALGKPLIGEGVVATKSYDPCVFEEDGKYTIFFGTGTYYCCELGDDMISVVSEPTKVEHLYANKEHVAVGDKPTIFKRGDWYYLISGADYGMSKNLKGPYDYVGGFIGAGHNDIFEFNGQLYVCYEFHDTNIFFRGIGVIKLEFNEDGTVRLPEDNPTVFHKERTWDFSKSDARWFLTNGEDCTHEDGGIRYKLNSFIGLKSPVFPGMFLEKNYKFVVDIENPEDTKRIKIMIETVKYSRPKAFLKCPESCVTTHVVEVVNGTKEYEVPINIDMKQHLKNISLVAFGPEDQGTIKIKSAKCIIAE